MYRSHSIGIDIVEIQRFNKLITKPLFVKKIYTEKEIQYCSKKSQHDATQSFAVRFAAKEAILKTLKHLIDYNKIEITHNRIGQPIVNFLDKKIKNTYRSTVSLSHTSQFAVASCLTYNVKTTK